MNGKLSRLCWWCAALGMAASSMAGCEAKGPASSQTKSAGPEAARDVDSIVRGPADVARLLHDLHDRRDYDAIAARIAADRREATIAILRGIDRVLDADARLRVAASNRYGGPHAVAWDLSVLRNNLGIFSAETSVINQSFEGERAMVAMQEGEHVPLVRAPFVREGGAWVYQPDLPPTSMEAELVKLAEVIDAIRVAVEGGEDFGPYLESFEEKVLPQMRAVVMAKDAVGPPMAIGGEPES